MIGTNKTIIIALIKVLIIDIVHRPSGFCLAKGKLNAWSYSVVNPGSCLMC
jgi:hypothetical protein